MGVSIDCMLIVGLHAEELRAGLPQDLRDRIEEEGFYDVVSEDGTLGLRSASPYFDSESDSRIWGISILSEYWGAIEVPDDLPALALVAKDKFKSITGLDGRLYFSANVT